jgi:MFS superfamily sulfate permease-like transporter
MEEIMSLTGALLGLINIAIYVAILVLIGLVIVWFASWLGFPIPAQIQKVYMIIVALIALYMIVALLLGLPVPGPIRLGALSELRA